MRSRPFASAFALILAATQASAQVKPPPTKVPLPKPKTEAAAGAAQLSKAPPPPPIQVACPATYSGRFWIGKITVNEPGVPGAGAPPPPGFSKYNADGVLFESAVFDDAELYNAPPRAPTDSLQLVCSYRYSYMNDPDAPGVHQLPMLRTYLSRNALVSAKSCHKANPALWTTRGSVPVDQQKPNGEWFTILGCKSGVNACIVNCDRS